MTLQELLQIYELDDILSVINEMFPGTEKFKKPLQNAYDILMDMTPTKTDKTITYKIITDKQSGESFMGADDADFDATWEECLGKKIIREKDVDLTDIETSANSLVNLCFISRFPKEFQESHALLIKG